MKNTSRLRSLLAIGVSGAALLGATSVLAQASNSPAPPSNPTIATPNSSPQKRLDRHRRADTDRSASRRHRAAVLG